MNKPALLENSHTEKELAAELRKDERTVMRWRYLRIGPPFFLIGKTPYYDIEAARAWLRARVVRPIRRRA